LQRPFSISHNSFFIFSTKDDSDSNSDSDAADSILLTSKTLQTHPRGIYRCDLTPDGRRRGFGTMHYKIEPWCDDIYVGHWKQDKIYGYDTYICSTGGSYSDWLNVNMSGKGHYTTSSGTSYHGNFNNNNLKRYGTYKTDKGKIYTGEYKDDIRHGLSKLITSEGEIYKGLFEDGVYIGSSSA